VKETFLSKLADSFAQYKRVLKYLRFYRGQFLLALLCMVLYGASDGVIPFLLKYALDHVFAAGNVKYLYVFPVLLIAISLFRAVADFGQQFLMARLGHLIVRDVRNEMDAKILALGPPYFLRHSSGDILARVNGDVQLLRMLLTDTVAAILRDSIRIIVLLTTAIILDPALSAIAFIALPLGVIPVAKFGKRLRKLSKRGQDAIGELGSLLNEIIVGSKVVKIFASENFEYERFVKENDRLTHTLIKSERIRAITGPVNEVLASFAVAGVVMYGGLSVAHGTRTQGDFIAFLMATFLLYDPFKKLSRISSTVHQGMAGTTRVFELLDAHISITSPTSPTPLPARSDITIENVSLKYETKEDYALHNISLTIKDGERIALVGFSGAGKSTLVDLIPRFIDPCEGVIKIGGVPLTEVSLNELRARITMVSQHTFLFNDSILNNIRYGLLNASRAEIEQAAADAYATDFIQKLPAGFDTVIGEGGLSLSGGERQRIAIARAILKNAPILILDEATASLDNKAERMVQLAIEKLAMNRTSLVIAHRLSTIQRVDRIVVMKAGKVVESGTHNELLELKGEYYLLYSYQFGNQPNVVD
jgi:ATP-binding cassette, subfamily B, bacterial MsbA